VVAPELDGEGVETGCYLVTAGERRRKALLLLVSQKKLKKTAPVTCLVRTDENAGELSLVENTVRMPMHPADQFEAFARLHSEQGLGLEEIAARFGITPAVVRQRLKLAAVSPALIEKYRAGELSLDQLMAFAVTDDHALQEETLAQLAWNKSPEMIRKALTSRHVSPRDRRAIFVGAEAYEAAGGSILRDLFAEDGGGWLTDSQLLDRLVREKLEVAAETIRNEGWKWVEA
jgi:ParB family chromosome partitioning protein